MQYDEARKYFAEGRLANEVQAQLQLYDLSVGEYLVNAQFQLYDLSVEEYLVNKYAIWLDFRTIDENELHRTGRQIGNTSGGITIQVEKKVEPAGALKAYLYLIMDDQLNIQNG